MTGSRRVQIVESTSSADIDNHASAAPSPISEQLKLIESTKATERLKGIQELSQMLSETPHNKLAATLSAPTWESIITWTVRIMIKETQSFVNKHEEEWPDITPSATRLRSRIQTQYSTPIRHIWVESMAYLSGKLARFLVKHVLESLASTGPESTFYLLGLDYAKVLKAWSTHTPHVMACKRSRWNDAVSVCTRGMSMATHTQSSDPVLSINPGDQEFATTLHSLIISAPPSRLSLVDDKVLDFALEFLNHYIYDNACHSLILDTVTHIILNGPDKQVIHNLKRCREVLAACLVIWPTRSVHVKYSLLRCIRTLILCLVNGSDERTRDDREFWTILELTLKRLVNGPWDRFKFTSIPHSVLSLYRFIPCFAHSRYPVLRLAPLHQYIDPHQISFFDTVAILVIALRNRESESSVLSDGVETQRPKRPRAAPTPLSRILATIREGEGPEPAVRGSAQVIWYILTMYPGSLSKTQFSECLESLVESLEVVSKSSVAEWILASIHALISVTGDVSLSKFGMTSDVSTAIWQHAVSAVEEGLFGASSLVFDLLHTRELIGSNIHTACNEVASALIQLQKPFGPDHTRLSLMLESYLAAKSSDFDLNKGILGLCVAASVRHWQPELFAEVLSHVVALECPCSVADPKELSNAIGVPALDASWNYELYTTQLLHTLEAFKPAMDAGKLLNRDGIDIDYDALRLQKSKGIRSWSQLSQKKRMAMASSLLGIVEEFQADPDSESSVGLLSVNSIPYILATALLITQGHNASEQGTCKFDAKETDVIAKIQSVFTKLANSTLSNAHIWQTISLTGSWGDDKMQQLLIAGLEQPRELVKMTFDYKSPHIFTFAAGEFIDDHYEALTEGHCDSSAASNDIEPNQRLLDYNESRISTTVILSQMATFVHGVMPVSLTATSSVITASWSPFLKTITSISAKFTDAVVASLLEQISVLVTKLDDIQFLVVSELLMHIIDIFSNSVSMRLGNKIKSRILGLLDAYDFKGQVATHYRVLLVIWRLIGSYEKYKTQHDQQGELDDSVLKFIAWLIEENKSGNIDVSNEVIFERLILGPWYAGTIPIQRDLDLLDMSPSHVLCKCAQESSSFLARFTAEHILASLGKRHSFLCVDGSLDYPPAENSSFADSDCVMITRNSGLALFINSARSCIPGALLILLKQQQKQADDESSTESMVFRLCNRLLTHIAFTSSFETTEALFLSQLNCIAAIDIEFAGEYIKNMYTSTESGSCASRTESFIDIATEWMVRSDLTQAIKWITYLGTSVPPKFAVRIFAHAIVISATRDDDNSLYEAIRDGFLLRIFTEEYLDGLITDHLYDLFLQILLLFNNDFNRNNGSENLAVQNKDDAIAQESFKFGRFYDASAIKIALERLAQLAKTSYTSLASDTPLIVWTVFHIRQRLQTTQFDDVRFRTLSCIRFLIDLLPESTIGDSLISRNIIWAGLDAWPKTCKSATTTMVFEIFTLVLGVISKDSSLAQTSYLYAHIVDFYLDNVASDTLDISGSEDMISGILLQLHNRVKALSTTGGVPSDYTDSETRTKVYLLAPIEALSGHIISSDRLALSVLVDAACTFLEFKRYSKVCIEFILGSVERLLEDSLVQDSCDYEDTNINKITNAEIDLSSAVVELLSKVKRKVEAYMHRSTFNKVLDGRTTTQLHRIVLLLSIIDDMTLPANDQQSNIASEELVTSDTVYAHVADVCFTQSDLRVLGSALSVTRSIFIPSDATDSSSVETYGSKKVIYLRKLKRMPPICGFGTDNMPKFPMAFDDAHLVSVCPPRTCASKALSSFVCSLATLPHANDDIRCAAPLIYTDSKTAARLLPAALYSALSGTTSASRAEITAFVLDLAHNWRRESPWLARMLIMGVLKIRFMDAKFADVRRFFRAVPIVLFQFADLAQGLGMPEAAAFLVECELTCIESTQPQINDLLPEARALLRSSYSQLGNVPAAQLLSSIMSTSGVLKKCRELEDWRTLLLYQEAMGIDGSSVDIGETLVNLGLLNTIVPGTLQESSSSGKLADAVSGPGISHSSYAAAWRLARWDIPGTPVMHQQNVSHKRNSVLLAVDKEPEVSLYNILRLRSAGQTGAARVVMEECMSRTQVSDLLVFKGGARKESWTYNAISLLFPLVSACSLSLDSNGCVIPQISKLTGTALAAACRYLRAEVAEPIHLMNMTLHEIALLEIAASSVREELKTEMIRKAFDQYKETIKMTCIASRQTKGWQTSMNQIFRLRKTAKSMGLLSGTLKSELKLWESEILWNSGSRNLALEVLHSHMKMVQGELAELTEFSDAHATLVSQIILTVGEWSDVQRKERAPVLWEEYFDKSLGIMKRVTTPTAWLPRAMHALGKFTERQCAEINAVCDDEVANAVRTHKQRELDACKAQLSSKGKNESERVRLRSLLRRLEIQVANDNKERDDLKERMAWFLQHSLWSYAICLQAGNAFDDAAANSLVSLIMTYAYTNELESALKAVSVNIEAVASRKFIGLSHQLCARLGRQTTEFQRMLHKIVLKITVEYPYHIMYNLFALRNANRTSSESSSSRRKSKGGVDEDMEKVRCEEATFILSEAAASSGTLQDIVSTIDNTCNAYIELAVSPVPDKFKSGSTGGKLIPFNSRMRIAKLVHNPPPNTPMLTAPPIAGEACDYGACVPFVVGISEGYTLAGGINMPKIIRVLGSDGRRYKQLVKGRDDMRQDAIIEQLFRVINAFMARAQDAAGLKGLSIRTYQVVPLTKRCGVLQWVDATQPLGDWFKDNDSKYRPKAPSIAEIRKQIHAVHKEKGVSAQAKLKIFEETCAKVPPIFRFFFYEFFTDAYSWFMHREVYMRSAAVSSIAGWVLGIGDRHLQNILIDRSSAELVHIDLGIAFDLGKLLPVPELVPFRLTREMVDGMGMLGIGGTFSHCCEVSLAAMRKNADVILTILNVLKVDPLYLWSISLLRQDKMFRRHEMIADNTDDVSDRRFATEATDNDESLAANMQTNNKEAERAILHVGNRLGSEISVDGQVNELVQQATDAKNLSRMYEGWCAWC